MRELPFGKELDVSAGQKLFVHSQESGAPSGFVPLRLSSRSTEGRTLLLGTLQAMIR